MPQCPSLPRCIFFNDKMTSRPATAAMMKKNYCETDNTNCARWLVCQAKGGPAVPVDLYPNERERVAALVA